MGIIFSLIAFIQVAAQADSGTAESTPGTVTAAKPAPDAKFSLVATLSNNTNFYKLDAKGYNFYSEAVLNPSIKLHKYFSVFGVFVADQTWVNSKDFAISDGVLGFGTAAIKPVDGFSIAPTLRFLVPVSTGSRTDTRTITAVTLRNELSYNFETSGVKQLTLLTRLNLTKSFYEEEASVKGKSNTSTSFYFRSGAAWDFNDMFSLVFLGKRAWAWAYDGKVKNTYGLYEEFDFNVTPNFGLALGLGNEGATAKDTGESSVYFFDNTSSEAYFQLVLSI